MDEPQTANNDPDKQRYAEAQRWSRRMESLLIILIVLVAIGFAIAQYMI